MSINNLSSIEVRFFFFFFWLPNELSRELQIFRAFWVSEFQKRIMVFYYALTDNSEFVTFLLSYFSLAHSKSTLNFESSCSITRKKIS